MNAAKGDFQEADSGPDDGVQNTEDDGVRDSNNDGIEDSEDGNLPRPGPVAQ